MADTSKTPARLSLAGSVIGLAFLVLGYLLAKAARGTVMVPAYLSSGVVMLLSLLAYGRATFARRQAAEEEQVAEYRRTHASTELFEDADEAVRMAARANVHYVKYFVPLFTIALGLAVMVAGVLLWRRWGSQDAFPVAQNPLSMAALSAILGLFAAVCGSYYVGVSREPGCRWLRPPGAWMFLSGGLFVLSGAVMLCEHFRKWVDVVDHRAALVGIALLVALGVELVLSFVIEFYRPRMPGESERPLPESRILALFTEPGGVARNVAASLDYQFGFQVSEVWFYRFLERAVVPFAVVMVALLWLLSCVVTLEPYENGIREHFGAVAKDGNGEVRILGPGFYLKLPWPFATIHKFPVEQVQSLIVGQTGGDEAGEDGIGEYGETTEESEYLDDVILWSKRHRVGELQFVVANDPRRSTVDTKVDQGTIPVSFLAVSIPVYFRVSNLYDYAYRHRNAAAALKSLATREVVRYLAQADFSSALGAERAVAGEVIARRIDASAKRHRLGVEIVFIGMQGIHPPVETGDAFDAVVGAREEMEEKILDSRAYATKKQPEADGERERLLNEAEAYRQERGQVSAAEAQRFRKQLLAYQASPKLFVLNSFLDVLENEGSTVRKYVVGTSQASEVLILDLQEKLRPDLLDVDTTKRSEDE
ncbi:MAG: protease modulator HflK [Lentisphaeria bacterium]|nr:protease modulator HflK [Lentisphaeria bacterium]